MGGQRNWEEIDQRDEGVKGGPSPRTTWIPRAISDKQWACSAWLPMANHLRALTKYPVMKLPRISFEALVKCLEIGTPEQTP